ncbi:MAG: hypothetical protein PVG39_14500, partial [Desulfobacteraceae bacterium]
KDPDYYDAYVGLGMYDYYLSFLPKIVRTLSFLGAYGDREKGLEEIILTSSKGSNYIKCGEYTQAETILNDLLESELNKNPPNNTFIADICFNTGIAEYELKKYQDPIQTFGKVLASNDVNKDWVKPWSHYYLGNSYSDIGETEKAQHEYDIAYKHEGSALKLRVDSARRKME